jgi:hypothetical protein
MLTRRPPENEGAQPGSPPVTVTVVESEACHFCDDARQVLTEVSAGFPVEVQVVDVRSRQGRALMQAHRAVMSPLVLVDGVFFSHGRLSRRKLVRVLDQRFPAMADRVTDGAGRG